MDKVRYYLALLLLAVVPPSILYWFSIHPLIRFWRRLGIRLTFAINYAAMIALIVPVLLFGKPLLSVEFGTNPILIGMGILLLVVSAALRRSFSRHLRHRILVGLPELAPEKHGIPLLTEGAYGRIRHPRYVQLFLAVVGYALFCNYLALYLLIPVLAAMLYCVVRIEERELRERFGAEYETYCARVPRFIPKLRK
jgi:protein-S-isoprenylcysteine O-methyltransferase Ste14